MSSRGAADLTGRIHDGMSLAELEEVALSLGGSVEAGHRHGETRVSHPLHAKRIVVHGSRKDAPLAAVRWLREVCELAAAVETLQRYRPDVLCTLVRVVTMGDPK